MPLYLDACAFVKRYLDEGTSSERMREITGRFMDWGGFVVSSYVEPEVVSAFAKHARTSSGHLVGARIRRKHLAVVQAFRQDLSSVAFTVIPLSDDVVSGATHLLEHHPEYNISAGDALHLATAMEIRPKLTAGFVFVTADRRLERAAQAEGFATVNPLYDGAEALEPIFPPRGAS
jgi:predicted nucleic acid-binding protein